jgi:hypothetical protein
MLFAFLVALCAVLPGGFLRDRFVSQGTILVAMIAIWLIPVHYQRHIILDYDINLTQYMALLFVWIISFVVVWIVLSNLLRRYSKFERYIIRFTDRLTVLVGLYVLLDAISVITILFRNIHPALI